VGGKGEKTSKIGGKHVSLGYFDKTRGFVQGGAKMGKKIPEGEGGEKKSCSTHLTTADFLLLIAFYLDKRKFSAKEGEGAYKRRRKV